MSSRFGQAMELMRRRNPRQQEDGFALLRDHAAEHVDELMAEFAREGDHGLRCWLLKLIGEARSPRAVPLLAAQLHGPEEALRSWRRPACGWLTRGSPARSCTRLVPMA